MSTWDPLRELERLRREMDEVADRGLPWRRWPLGFLPASAARQYPRVNVAATNEGYVLEALAPGADVTGLDVSVKGNVLTISGEKLAPKDVAPEAYHRSERAAGRFVRTLELPEDIAADKVTASYRDGILRLELPKAETAKPRQIEVQVG